MGGRENFPHYIDIIILFELFMLHNNIIFLYILCIMKVLKSDMQKIKTFEKGLMGIFSSADLKNLFNETDGLKLNRRINNLLDAGVLARFSRGVFTSATATLDAVCARIHEDSYVSLASALSKHLMIGTLPAKTVFAVRSGRAQTFCSSLGKVVYAGAQSEQIWGFETIEGINYATPEKALLDMLYYHQKGWQFYFDIYSDVNLSPVKSVVIHSHLKRYKNCRFTAFVEGYLNDRLPQ